jgi:hypothetical protein
MQGGGLVAAIRIASAQRRFGGSRALTLGIERRCELLYAALRLCKLV